MKTMLRLRLLVLATFVRTGVSVMPFFRKTEISDKDLGDLGNYLSSPETR